MIAYIKAIACFDGDGNWPFYRASSTGYVYVPRDVPHPSSVLCAWAGRRGQGV